MKKSNLFLLAAAPVAMILPMEVQASEENIHITMNGANELTATVHTSKKIKSYQWYTVVDGNANEISGEISSSYSVPLGSNIELLVKVILEDDSELVSQTITIQDIHILGDLRVNSTISADIASIPNKPTMKSFQWYYYDNGNKTVIDGATDIEFIIPAKAAGKQLFVETLSEEGEQFVSEAVQIEKLVVVANSVKIKGYSANQYVVPGDLVTAFDPEISIASVDENGVITEVNLLEDETTMNRLMDQVTFTYQWLYKVDDSYAFIEGASEATYTVPIDAEERHINTISVRVIATVGETASTPTYSPILEIVNIKTENSPVKNLVEKINKLLKNTNTMDTYNESIIDANNANDLLKNLLKDYNALTPAAKEKVTNYHVLKRAIEDWESMTNFAQLVGNANTEAELKALLLEYEQFDLLKRSTGIKVDGKGIFELIQEKLGNVNEVNEVKEINLAILDLLKTLTVGNTSYELVEYKIQDIKMLKEEIKSIEDDIAKLPQDYKGIVQNQDIIKNAKSDIKKVETFLEKLKKIDLTATPKKQLTAAKSVRSAYNKLTIKQLSLVPENDIQDFLIAAEHVEIEAGDELQLIINSLIEETTKEYLEPPSEFNWKDYVKTVDNAVLKYKNLSKDTAKHVENYSNLLQLQKDLKIAEKVITQIDKYTILLETEGVSYAKQLSAYNSADKALKKLTTLQKGLVYNKGSLEKPETTPSEGDKVLSEAEQEAKEQGEAFVDEIIWALENNLDDFEAYSKEIDAVVMKYKNLNSKARKYVTNYQALKEAEKDVKAVRSFLKKVEAAETEIDPAKKYTKIASVKTSYLKLPDSQQKLATPTYSKLMGILEESEDFVDLLDLNDRIGAIISSNGSYTKEDELYKASIDEIKNMDEEYKKLSSAEKKQITNYSILKNAMADVKKVQSFETKYNKVSEQPSAAIIKAFNALSARQAALVSTVIRTKLIEAETQQRNDNERALQLADSINQLEIGGLYVDGLKDKVDELQAVYETMSSKEKSLVKNYSKLTRAQNDLVKIAEVKAINNEVITIQQEIVEQEAALESASGAGEILIKENIAKLEKDQASKEKEWKKAFNRLSNKLEVLYKKMYPLIL